MRSAERIDAHDSGTPNAGALLQRKCDCGTHAGPACDSCADEKQKLQRHATGAHTSGAVPGIVGEVLRTPGTPLDTAARAFFEPRFARDFSRVRIHTDGRAAASAEAVQASAYTVGSDIVFGRERYQPASPHGRQLLAHELTHVVQQSGSPASGALRLTSPSDASERDADRASSAAINGSARIAPAGGRVVARNFITDLFSSSSKSSGDSSRSSSRSSGSEGGPGQQTAGGLPNNPANCRVDVRATHIGGFLSAFPIWHTFVVHADETGRESFFRGGPGGSCPGVAGTYGTIKTDSGDYTPGTIDWDPDAPSETVATGAAACGKKSCLAGEMPRIDATCTPYKPLGPNSNTVAKTILSNCGLPQRKPVLIAPGWGDPNL